MRNAVGYFYPPKQHNSSCLAELDSRYDSESLLQFRQIGFGAFGLQLLYLFLWSNYQNSQFSLTWDFAIYHQAWWLIGHGVFNPFETVNGYPFWSSHGELMMWPLAVLGRLWPQSVSLLWIQDIFLVGAEVVAFTWICDFAKNADRRRSHSGIGVLLAASGLVLLIADPWIYWTAAWDFHMEVVGLTFCLLVARDIFRNPENRRIWLWTAFALMCGDVTATYIAGIGISYVLVGEKWRRTGILVSAFGLGWMLFLTSIGANRASGLSSGYAYLTNVTSVSGLANIDLSQLIQQLISHPTRGLSVLWDRRLDLYGAVASGGLIGVFSPWVAVPTLLVLLENGLNSYVAFIVPGFQDSLLFVLIPVGTIAILSKLSISWFRISILLAILVAANTFAWGYIWIPRTSSQWIDVSPPAARLLTSIRSQIGSNDEAIVSQGLVGRFSARKWIYALGKSGPVPIHTSPTWIIISPNQGIELAAPAVSQSLIGDLAVHLHAHLVAHGSDIWAFRWTPTMKNRKLYVNSSPTSIYAWTATGPVGRAIYRGAPNSWEAISTGRKGYVIAGDYWREPPGKYLATVQLSTTTPINLEVWNTTGNTLLSRKFVPRTNGLRTIQLLTNASVTFRQSVFGGRGIFHISPVPPPPGNVLEVRIWTSGHGLVRVVSVGLSPLGN